MKTHEGETFKGKASWKCHEGETSEVRARPHEGETSEIVRWRDIMRARPQTCAMVNHCEGETSRNVQWQTIVRARPQGICNGEPL